MWVSLIPLNYSIENSIRWNSIQFLIQKKNIYSFQLFFDGVVAKVAQGVKESEIGYQMAFSKQELRKVISLYPGREVKKGIEALYRKVEKHLSDEGNLLQVKRIAAILYDVLH